MIDPDRHLHIASLLFEGIDQIDPTGPFEILWLLPSTTCRIDATTIEPASDVNGLRIIADALLEDAPHLDVPHVPGGFGQEDLMRDEQVLAWLKSRATEADHVLSVCNGSLLCDAACLLVSRRAAHRNERGLRARLGIGPARHPRVGPPLGRRVDQPPRSHRPKIRRVSPAPRECLNILRTVRVQVENQAQLTVSLPRRSDLKPEGYAPIATEDEARAELPPKRGGHS